MKILAQIISLCQKVLNPIKAVLSNFKVIYQIGLIILVMTGFLVIQGLLALNSFNKMQKIAQKVFSSSIQGFEATVMIRQDYAFLQGEYTRSLLSNLPLSATLTNVTTTILTLKSMIPVDAIAQVELLEKTNKELEDLLKKPVTLGNYNELKTKLNLLALSLKNVEDAFHQDAIKSMERGNSFFEQSRNINILLLVVSLLVSLGLGSGITALIAVPLKAMVNTVSLMAAGDFTQTLKLKGSREVTQLVSSLNHAIASLRHLISNIHEQAEVLARAGKELSKASEESGKSAGEVARAVESMAKSATEQSTQMLQTANNVTNLGNLVERVSKDSMRIAKSSGQVANSAKNGQKIATEVEAGIGELYLTTKEVSGVIDEMSRSSERIKEITSIINGIAEQTSLLALNASIEAARAGVHGRGFSVVAQETGKLADQSKQASQTINGLVNEMIEGSRQAVTAIQKGVDEVEKGKALTGKAAITFENIFQQLEDTLTQINNVAQTAEQMAKHNAQVVDAVTSVAAISEEGMATTEEISATVEEQTASAEQVAGLAANLSEIAQKMNQAVATFKI